VKRSTATLIRAIGIGRYRDLGNHHRAVTALIWSHLFSQSQIASFRECQRRWGWKYLHKLFTEQTPAQKLGDEIEKQQLVPYLTEGRQFNFSAPTGSGYMAAELLPFLPQPKTPGLEMQKRLVIPSPSRKANGEHVGFGYQGFVDLWLPDSSLVPDMPGGRPFVGDFKSTKSFDYAKTRETLATDVQANLYAFATMSLTGAREVDLKWMYTRTKGARRAKQVILRVVADQVAEQFQKINETGLELKVIRDANPHPLELPPSPDQCEAYGGCPYRDKCNLSPTQINQAFKASAARGLGIQEEWKMANVSANPSMGLLAQLQQQRTGVAPQPAAPAPTPGVTAGGNPKADYDIIGQKPDGSPLYRFELTRNAAPTPPVQAPVIITPPVQAPMLPPGTPGVTPELQQYAAQNPAAAWLLQQPPSAQPTPPVQAPTDPRYNVVGQKPDGSPLYAYEAQGAPAPINPPESTLPPAPPVNAAPTPPAPTAEAPKRRGRPAKAQPDPLGADAHAAVTNVAANVDAGELIKIAKALRAGCDAFLAVMEAQ